MPITLSDLDEDRHQIGADTRELVITESWCPAITEAGVLFCGISDAAPGFEFVWRTHPFAAILFCFSGAGEALVEGRFVPFRPGMAYVMSPGELAAYQVTGGGRWGLTWLAYNAADGRALPFAPRPSLLIHVDPTPVRAALEGLHSEALGRADIGLMRLWVELAHHYVVRATQPLGGSQQLGSLWQQVDRDLAHDWNLDEMADLANVSREQLRRLCQQQLNCSPMDHVTRLRMRRAQGLLRTKNAKLRTIAGLVGYSSPYAFSSAFRRFTGQSPTAFQATQAEKAASSPARGGPEPG